MIDWSTIKHFHPAEFACKGTNCCGGANEIKPELVDMLDQVRGRLNKPMHVTSGYRCPVHDKVVGGAGPHVTGYAVDIAVSGYEAFAVLKLALAIGFTGIGVSQHGPSRFIHLDIVPGPTRPALWSYS